MPSATTPSLGERIQHAQVVFVTAASRLLDEAEDVRRQRDELLRLLAEQNEQAELDRKGGCRA